MWIRGKRVTHEIHEYWSHMNNYDSTVVVNYCITYVNIWCMNMIILEVKVLFWFLYSRHLLSRSIHDYIFFSKYIRYFLYFLRIQIIKQCQKCSCITLIIGFFPKTYNSFPISLVPRTLSWWKALSIAVFRDFLSWFTSTANSGNFLTFLMYILQKVKILITMWTFWLE